MPSLLVALECFKKVPILLSQKTSYVGEMLTKTPTIALKLVFQRKKRNKQLLPARNSREIRQ